MDILNLVWRRAALNTVAMFLLIPSVAFSAENGLFQGTDALMAAARDADAALLAPQNFEAAEVSYRKAKDQDGKGRADRAGRELEKTNALLNKALEVSRLGKVSFANTLKLRNLAMEAEALTYEPEMWQRAEDQFETAARALESGNVNSANDKSGRAASYFAEAELAAIKTAIVGKARQLIAAADDNRVSRQAPDMLNKAKDLVSRAEASLDKQRYSTEGPIALAAEAEYEARHADYLASQIRRLEGKDITAEQLLLEWEQPIKSVAAALDVTTDLSAGFAKSAAASTAMAENLTEQNIAMSARVAELEQKLGGNEAIVAESQRLNRQLAEVESLFGLNQARVVREGNDLVLRLVGLSFPSGQSVIETQYYSLLRNVQRAISVFPDATIAIEGHTDSVGSDAINMKLSQDRANSVREYLIANLGLPESRVEAFGYGKSRPIASNDSVEGRAQNRRIDVVIRSVRARQSG